MRRIERSDPAPPSCAKAGGAREPTRARVHRLRVPTFQFHIAASTMTNVMAGPMRTHGGQLTLVSWRSRQRGRAGGLLGGQVHGLQPFETDFLDEVGVHDD